MLPKVWIVAEVASAKGKLVRVTTDEGSETSGR